MQTTHDFDEKHDIFWTIGSFNYKFTFFYNKKIF